MFPNFPILQNIIADLKSAHKNASNDMLTKKIVVHLPENQKISFREVFFNGASRG